MTLTLRSASTTTATTKGAALTHAEMDANWLHALQSTNQEFFQSGSGALSETTEDALRRLVHTAQYDTAANFNTARAALTGTLGITPQVQFANFDATSTTPAGLIYGGATFNGTYDPVIYLGYNISGQSANTKVNSSEPMLKFGLEGNYNNGSANMMEWNLDYLSDDGGTDKRLLGFEINRSTDVAAWSFAGTTHTFYQSTVGTSPSFQISLTNWTTSPVVVIRAAGGSNELFQFGPTTAGAFTNFQFGFGAASGSGGQLDTTSTVANLRVGATAVVSATATGAAVTGTLSTSGLYTANANITVSGVSQPSITFTPSSGSTMSGVWYQSGDTLLVARAGVGNRFAIDISTGNIALNGQGISTSTGLLTSAGTTGVSSLRVPHGSAPTSPVDGDVWTTTAGLFVRVNGSTVGPLS